jgi:UDP-glucose 4,6-dehydratase
MGPCYVWRPGLPFNEAAVRRNFLWNLQRAGRICDSINSLSHVDDFVRACLTLWERQAPFGIYHVVNPGLVPTRRVTQLIERILKPKPGLNFWEDADPNRPSAARVTHFHRLLDPMKLREARVEMRPAEDALEDALRHWQTGRPIRREFPGASPSARNYL